MKNTTLFILLIISSTVLAQDYGDFKPKNGSHHIGQVSGKLIDAQNGSPLAFANVRLFRTNDILLEGTISDDLSEKLEKAISGFASGFSS